MELHSIFTSSTVSVFQMFACCGMSDLRNISPDNCLVFNDLLLWRVTVCKPVGIRFPLAHTSIATQFSGGRYLSSGPRMVQPARTNQLGLLRTAVRVRWLALPSFNELPSLRHLSYSFHN